MERECNRYRRIADLEASSKALETQVAELQTKLALLVDEVTRMEERKRALGAGFRDFLKQTGTV